METVSEQAKSGEDLTLIEIVEQLEHGATDHDHDLDLLKQAAFRLQLNMARRAVATPKSSLLEAVATWQRVVEALKIGDVRRAAILAKALPQDQVDESQDARMAAVLGNLAALETAELQKGRRNAAVAGSTRRVNANFSDQAYRTLEQLASQTNRSMSDVLRDAIALKAWFEQTRAEGGHVLVEHPDGKVREVISV